MEEFSPVVPTEQEDKTEEPKKPSKKRRLLSFVDTYYPSENRVNSPESADEGESPFASLIDKLKGLLFKKSLVLEPLVPAPAEALANGVPADIALEKDDGPADLDSFGLLYERPTDQATPLTADVSTELPSPIATLENPAAATTVEEITDRLARLGEESTEQEQSPSQEIQSTPPTSHRSETFGYVGGAQPVSEIIQDRHISKLRREVRHLKRKATDAKTQQNELKKQQEKAADVIAEQQAHKERFEQVTLPRLEKSRQELRQRIEAPLPPKPLEVAAPAAATQPESTLSSVLRPRESLVVPTIETTKTTVLEQKKSEAVQHTVEQAAEKNIAIESVYEHRHETKDEPRTTLVKGGKTAEVLQSSGSIFAPDPDIMSPVSRLKDNMSKILSEEQNKQAMKGGFWAAIVVIIMLGVLVFIVR